MTTHPLILEIGVAVCFLSPTAIPRLYRATRRAAHAVRAHVERVHFHRNADRTWRAEERAQRQRDRAEASAVRLTVPESDPRYREIMRTYYAAQILAPMPSSDSFAALLAARAQVAQQWADALDDATGAQDGGAA